MSFLFGSLSEEERDRRVANEIIRACKKQVDATQPSAERPIRCFHSKTIACFKGTFTVLNPPAGRGLDKGLFSKPGVYDCYLRYSDYRPYRGHEENIATGEHDFDKLTHGLGVYVDLANAGFEHEGKAVDSHCFVMADMQEMPIKTAYEFRDIVKYTLMFPSLPVISAVLFLIIGFLKQNLKPVVKILGNQQSYDSLYQLDFYSTLPFYFGDQTQVTYHFQPSMRTTDFTHGGKNVGTAKKQMEGLLQKTSLSYDVYATVVSGGDSEFKVGSRTMLAKLTIPQGSLAWDEIEKMAFHLLDGVHENRPFGMLNRVRGLIYKEMAQYRNAIKGCPAMNKAAAATAGQTS